MQLSYLTDEELVLHVDNLVSPTELEKLLCSRLYDLMIKINAQTPDVRPRTLPLPSRTFPNAR